MTILNVKKLRHFSVVSLEDQELKIENEIMYKFKIETGKTFTKDEFNEIIEENRYYYYDRIAVKQLNKSLTKHELTEFLFKEGANKKLVEALIKKYVEYNYLNDSLYVKLYVDDRINSKGPKVIKNRLKEKGIEIDLIDQYLLTINEDEVINELVLRTINKPPRNKNKQEIITSLKSTLINNGYTMSKVLSIVDNNAYQLEVNERPLIEKEFNKLYKKLKDKKDEKDLPFFIKTKLYQKGYSNEDINYILLTSFNKE